MKNYKSTFDRFVWTALDWVFPPVCACCHKPNSIICPDCLGQASIFDHHVCQLCGKPLNNSKSLCSVCEVIPRLYSGMRSWAVYDKTVREAIHSLKYKNNISLGYFFSQQIQPLINIQLWDFNVVIPVPLSKKHLIERGYNQSSLIAQPLSHQCGKTFLPNALIRNRETKSQFELTAQERFENVKDAFLGNPAKLKGKGVLLVDDVITTGATMENCTKALIAAGAARVYCVSVARVPVSE